MNYELVKRVIERARFYPSGDNSQPFRFRLVENQLHVDYFEPAARHTLIYDDMLILLTLGGLIHYLQSSFALEGINITWSLDLTEFNFLESSSSIAIFSPSDKSSRSDVLAQEISKRVTDRRPFQPFHTVEIDTSLFNNENSAIRCDAWVNAQDEALHFFAACDSLVWRSKSLVLDIINSVSFENETPKRGLPWRNLGVSYSETLPIRLVQKYPSLYGLFSFLVKAGMNLSQRKLWESSRSCLVFSFQQELNRNEKAEAYRKLMKFLMELNQQGYHYQPSTMSTEILNAPLKSPNLGDSAKLNLSPYLKEINAVRESLQLEDKVVAWIVRIGKPLEPFPAMARTSRLDVEDLLTTSLPKDS